MSDLDSFFAKKDKKKLKGKKFTTTDEIAKRLEIEKKAEKSSLPSKSAEVLTKKTIESVPTAEVSTPTEQQKVEERTAVTTPVPEPVIKVEEEQWNDFKDDEAVDVSNLKITKLNIEEEEDGVGGEGGEEGKENFGEDKKDGVWKIEEQKSMRKVICEAVDAALDDGLQDVKATVAAMNANAPRWTSSLSKELAAGPLPRGLPGSRRKKAAPDINNASAFPTLADSKSTAGRKKAHEDFEGRTNHHTQNNSSMGGRISGLGSKGADSGPGVYKPPSFRTGNRFGALTDHGALKHS